MQYKLSFANVNLLANNIIEIRINKNIEVSLEMLDESRVLIEKLFPHESFGILMNRIYPHSFSFEAKLCMGSYENLSAIAVVIYSKEELIVSNSIQALRQADNWTLQNFSGLELGWQEAQKWLITQLPKEELIIDLAHMTQSNSDQLSA
jgi:hypothetical protein